MSRPVTFPVEKLDVMESKVFKGTNAKTLKTGVWLRQKNGTVPRRMRFLFRTLGRGVLVTRVK